MKRSTSQSGFSLVELAIVILITGVLMGGSFSLLKPYLESAQRNGTKTRLENMSQAIALYAQSYGRLPCPADPTVTGTLYGSPRNSGSNGTETANNCGGGKTNYVGILPFRALGLDEDQAKDAYGNLVTYGVSLILADPGNNNQIHAQCRVTSKWVDGGVNKNPRKATLCCPKWSPASDVVQVLAKRNGSTTTDNLYTGSHDLSGGPYDSPTTSVAAAPAANDIKTHMIAYVLVSHGENGDGAYIGQSTNTRPVTTANTSAEESENRETPRDLNFVSRPIATVDDDKYFDDIVLWKTNDQVVNAFGNDSCARP